MLRLFDSKIESDSREASGPAIMHGSVEIHAAQ
jgi:hypothetical protein